MLGVVGCEEDSDPTSTGLFNFDTDNPGDNDFSGIDWAVVASAGDESKLASSVFIVPMYDSIWLDPYPYVESISLTINGDAYTPEMLGDDGFYTPMWWVNVDMAQGEEYPFQLNVTELDLTSHTYTANVTSVTATSTFTYPGYFVPGEPVTFDWTLANSNQYQIATVDTYYYEWSTNNEYEDEYTAELSNSLRSYTFPANCVDDFGDDTGYMFSIDQVNQTVNGRFVAVSTFSDYMDYYKKGGITKEAHAIRLLKTLGLR